MPSPAGWHWTAINEPPGDAIVVRGGEFGAATQKAVLRSAAEDHDDPDYADHHIYPVSVHCAVRDADEEWTAFLCRVSLAAELPHSKVRWTTVDRVKEAGFRLFYSPPPPSHFDIDLGTVDQSAVDRLVALLEPAEANPCPSEG